MTARMGHRHLDHRIACFPAYDIELEVHHEAFFFQLQEFLEPAREDLGIAVDVSGADIEKDPAFQVVYHGGQAAQLVVVTAPDCLNDGIRALQAFPNEIEKDRAFYPGRAGIAESIAGGFRETELYGCSPACSGGSQGNDVVEVGSNPGANIEAVVGGAVLHQDYFEGAVLQPLRQDLVMLSDYSLYVIRLIADR